MKMSNFYVSMLGEVFLHRDDVLEILKADIPCGIEKIYCNFLGHLEQMPMPPINCGAMGLRMEAELEIEEKEVKIHFYKDDNEQLFLRFQDLMKILDSHEKMSAEGAIKLGAPVEVLTLVNEAFNLLRSRLKDICDETGHKAFLESN